MTSLPAVPPSDRPGLRPGPVDLALVADRLATLTAGTSAHLDLAEPLPTAAFSGRDRHVPGYAEAWQDAVSRGFEPITRPVGGHLAAYGPGSLVVHWWDGHPEPRLGIRERFERFSGAIAAGLRDLGVPAQVGPVPGEYCDGEYSVNLDGRSKLVGTGQRIVRHGFLASAVVMVHSVEPARDLLTSAYALMGLAFDPATVGCVADAVPDVSVEEVADRLRDRLAAVL